MNILEILQSIHPEIDYEREKNLIDNGIFDSFDLVTLISGIRQEIGIKIPAYKITPDNFNSLESINKLLSKQEQ